MYPLTSRAKKSKKKLRQSFCFFFCKGQEVAPSRDTVEFAPTPYQGIHTGRVVGQITAPIGPYNLLWCRRYKKIVLTPRYYRGDRRANYRRANCLKYCKQIVFEIFARLSA